MTSTTPISDAMATVSFADADNNDIYILLRQFISEPLTAGQTVTGAQTTTLQIRGQEVDATNNMFVASCIRIIAADGSTVQKTVKLISRDTTEFASASMVNRNFAVTSVAGNYTTVAGDRLVFEVGVRGDPVSLGHDSSLRFGDSAASDLPEDDTTTTDLRPWYRLNDTLTFTAAAAFLAKGVMISQAVKRASFR